MSSRGSVTTVSWYNIQSSAYIIELEKLNSPLFTMNLVLN